MEETLIFMVDLALNHLLHKEFITKIEINGAMKDLWCVY